MQQERTLPQDTLARFGAVIVTARDLRERIELMPWPEKGFSSDQDSSKMKALSSLIAEKLLSLEASVMNVGESEETALMLQGLERVLARDELYRREVRAKINVSEKEIREGLKRYAAELRVLMVGARSQSDAGKLYDRLSLSSDIESEIRRIDRSMFVEQDTITVNFGGLDVPFEDEVYGLVRFKPGPPLQSQFYGWVVPVLLDAKANPVYLKQTITERRKRVEEEIRRRNEDVRAGTYSGSVLKSKHAASDSVMFERFAGTLLATIEKDSASHRNGGAFMILPEDLDKTSRLLHTHLGEFFVHMESGGMTLGEVIEAFRYERFAFSSLDPRRFRFALNNCIRVVVQGELLGREALKQNLHFARNVRHDLEMWRSHRVARQLLWRIVDTVGVNDEELMAYLARQGEAFTARFEVDIQEVLSEKVDLAAALYDSLQKGSSFFEIARRYSTRKEWAANGGRSGFFPISQYPRLGFTAMVTDTGKIVGPIVLEDGLSILRVLGKRSKQGEAATDFDSLMSRTRANLLIKKRAEVVNGYLSDLASKYSLEVRKNSLRSLRLNPVTMFTNRYMGFGGVMNAVPMLMPQWEWLRDWEKRFKITP